MEWFYSGLGGIGQTENSVAYKEITINPDMIAGLSHAAVGYDSSYGLIKCNWTRQDKTVSCLVEIPVNTKALITLELASGSMVSEGGRPVSEVRDIQVISKKDGQLVCKV